VKLAVYDDYRVGVVQDDGLHDVTAAIPGWDPSWPQTFMLRTIADFAALRPAIERAATDSPARALDGVKLLPPVPCPNKIVAAPTNYVRGAVQRADLESMYGPQTRNVRDLGMFLKAPSSLVGAGDPIVLPYPDRRTDYEAELAVIVGQPARHVSRAEAMRYVFGYAVALDVTVRGGEERSQRKSYDTFTPLGPWLTTADEVSDPDGLAIRLWLNGDLRQDGSTAQMILGIAELIEYTSDVMTLYPGDVISTGTPDGMGPLADGDTVIAEVEAVGRMTLRVRAAAR
jgi:2-keto-4-pentenoate hydratase/2-oxohepta-3-ene-1,7-dioic acid hydratase in catechol pathway